MLLCYNIDVIVLLPDVQLTWIWKEIQGFKDPELARLAKALPETVSHARVSTTTKKYTAAYLRWKSSVEKKHSGKSFPVNGALFALYLQYLGEESESRSIVSEAVSAIYPGFSGWPG